MKKLVSFILLITLLIIPMLIKASEITTFEIQALDEVTVGNEFSVGVYIGLDDLKKGTLDSYGIAGILYEIDFDDSILDITDIAKIDSFKSDVYETENTYYVLSYIDDTNASKNKCADEVLYCADYLETLKFYIKDTEVEKTEIKITNVNVMLFPVGSSNEEDMITISSNEKSHIINIKQQEKEVITSPAPETVITNSSNVDIKEEIKNNVETVITNSNNNENVQKKDSNNYLSSIKIENYKIDFNRDKLEYSIDVKETVNKLNINVVSESKLSIVNIKGADDLKSNNYKITIDVTAENKVKRTYTVNVNTIEQEESELNDSSTDKFIDLKFKISDKTKTIIIISIAVLSVVIIIVSIIFYKKDREIDNKLNKL